MPASRSSRTSGATLPDPGAAWCKSPIGSYALIVPEDGAFGNGASPDERTAVSGNLKGDRE